MDMQMPGMDGLEATRRITAGAARPEASRSIVAMTASVRVEDREACEQRRDGRLPDQAGTRG